MSNIILRRLGFPGQSWTVVTGSRRRLVRFSDIGWVQLLLQERGQHGQTRCERSSVAAL